MICLAMASAFLLRWPAFRGRGGRRCGLRLIGAAGIRLLRLLFLIRLLLLLIALFLVAFLLRLLPLVALRLLLILLLLLLQFGQPGARLLQVVGGRIMPGRHTQRALVTLDRALQRRQRSTRAGLGELLRLRHPGVAERQVTGRGELVGRAAVDRFLQQVPGAAQVAVPVRGGAGVVQ